MSHFVSRMKPFLLPALATLAFVPLLAHQSESPAVLNKYSTEYTILLSLCALNLALFWRISGLRLSYDRLRERLSARTVVSILLLVISLIFLVDFIGVGSLWRPSDWVNSWLLGLLPLQVVVLREKRTFLASHLALVASSVVLTLIILELIFVFFLAESQTPQSQREFLRLMSSQWPQPISVSKPPGTFRILGLSDSFGTTGGTTSNYHYLLRDILRQEVSRKIQVINISVEGYDLIQELAILRYGLAYSPDLVIHGFFVGNDFATYGNYVRVYTYRSIPIIRNLRTPPYMPRNFLTRNWIWRTFAVLQQRWKRNREVARGIVDRAGDFPKSTFLKIQYRRMREWGKRADEDLVRMRKVFLKLDAIRAAVEESGARYVMVIHPDQTQVDDDLRQDIITTFQVNQDSYDFDLPQKLLHSYCKDREIPCLDLLPVFREKAKDGDLYLLRDTHYNHNGNDLAAAEISEFLQGRQLLVNTRDHTAPRANSTPPLRFQRSKTTSQESLS